MANWSKLGTRGNVDDRRGAKFVGGISITSLVIILLFNILTGGNLTDVLFQVADVATITPTQQVNTEFEGADSYEQFASLVLGSNDLYWEQQFATTNPPYQKPTLVLFRDVTQSACGVATAQVGPHYCPLDQTIYLDETFFDELQNRFGATGGDVAEAYVIAHEVGHHVQNLKGQLHSIESQQDAINLELQADCYAGLWAHSLKGEAVLEPNEIEEAIDAAAAVGDDRIQEKVTGQVNPETWTHGSAEQRVAWFTKGYETGSLEQCNTF